MNEIVRYYNNLAESYDKNRFEHSYGKFLDKQERIILDRLLNQKDEVILDLACGSGRLMNYANFGIDASPKMIEIAKLKFKDKPIYLSDAENTNIESGSIDTIIIFHLFMHLEKDKIERIFQECNRILKKNGRIIFDIPSQKRRKLINYKPKNWHGANSCSIAELKRNSNFEVNRTFGLLFLPIHQFPKVVRKFIVNLDLLLANSFLKEFSSYMIIEFTKK